MVDHSERPFYALSDSSYDNIYAKLKRGSRYEWSYIGVCPHPKGQCCCPKFMNVLKDDRVVRIVNAKQRPVFRGSDLVTILANEHTSDVSGVRVLAEEGALSQMHIHLWKFEERENYDALLKEVARAMWQPMAVHVHMSDGRVMTVPRMDSLQEFEDIVDKMASMMQ